MQKDFSYNYFQKISVKLNPPAVYIVSFSQIKKMENEKARKRDYCGVTSFDSKQNPAEFSPYQPM